MLIPNYFFNGKLLKKVLIIIYWFLELIVNLGDKVFKVNLMEFYQRDEHKDILLTNLRKIARVDLCFTTAESYAPVPPKVRG